MKPETETKTNMKTDIVKSSMRVSVAVASAISCIVVSSSVRAGVKCPVSGKARGHENIEWSIGYAYSMTDANRNLPRVLLVGDSICNGYQSAVRAKLSGKMTVTYWASSLCVTSPGYLRMLGYYLDESEYAVIHFNNGLHSLTTPDAAYEKGLKAALDFIAEKQPRAKIVWCSSTPLKGGKLAGKVRALNEIGAREAKRRGLPINDLYALLDPLDRAKNWTDTYHHRGDVYAKEGARVAEVALDALEASGKRPAAVK